MPAKNNHIPSTSRPGFKLKAASLAVMTAAVFSSSWAAGLGKISVLSGLGQPLNAEIELTTVNREEASGLSVRLAPVEEFRRANIELNPALYSLKFAIEQRGNRHVVRVTSAQPLNEPFIDMLLEVSSANSRLVREYTFLLDPPELRRVQPAQAAVAPAPAPATTMSSAQTANAAARQALEAPSGRIARATAASGPARSDAPAARSSSAPATTEQQVQVKRGDTLHRIATQVKPDGVSLDQMLVALYRANPGAFIDDNMNRMRAGQILKVPDSSTAAAISQREARGLIVAQAADFNSYRAKLAAQIAAAKPAAASEGSQTAGGQIQARVEEAPTPANTATDRLTVSRSGLAQGGTGTEDRIAAAKAAAEVEARVKELEKNLNDLQKLLELKNREMAALQQQAGGGATTAPAADGSPTTVPLAASDSAATSTATTAAATSAAAPADADTATAGNANAATAGVDTPATAATPTPSAAAGAAAGTGAAAAPAAAAKPAAPAAKPKPVPPSPPPEPSLVEELLDNPMVLGASGLLLALLAALGIRAGRQRRERKQSFSDSALLSETELKTNSIFGATGGQSVDTSNSIFNSHFAPSSSQLDTNEVDPVAEADVYIAYGRDAQAEEILKEALRTQPNRHAVRVKLLEIYASRKDLRAFETVATELYSVTRGAGPEWNQAAQLGVTIDPNNPLYAGSKPAAAPAAETATAAAGTAVAAGAASVASSTSGAPEDLDLDALLNTTVGGSEEANADTAHSLEFDDESATPASASETPANASPAVHASASNAATSAADSADDNLLEFDLAEPATAEPAPKAAATSVEPAAEARSDENTLDFDFDMDGLDSDNKRAAATEPVATATAAAATTDTKPAPEAVAGSATESADSLLDFNFDLLKPVDSKPIEPVPALAAESASEPDDLDDDAELPALPTLSDDASAAQPAVPLEFDLSAINLDLNQPVSAAMEAPVAPTATAPASTSSSSAGNAEMATKLDLAMAYQEMGDTDGARELLEEVQHGGTPEQAEKARSLLLQLS